MQKIPSMKLIGLLLNLIPAFALSWFFASLRAPKISITIFSNQQQQIKVLALAIFIYFIILGLKQLYLRLISYYKLREYWQHEFSLAMDIILVILPIFYLIFLTHKQVIEIATLGVIFFGSYFVLRYFLKRHPEFAKDLVSFGDTIFLMVLYIFGFAVIFQEFVLQHFYTIDSVTPTDNLIAYRSIAIASLWLMLLSFVSLFFKKDKKSRKLLMVIWLVTYFVALILEIINVGVIYYSGLYINPVLLEHVAGGQAVMAASVNFFILGLVLIVPSTLLVFLFIGWYQKLMTVKVKYQKVFFLSILFISFILFIIFFPLAGTLPEKIVIKSFVNYYFSPQQSFALNDVALAKLKKFGLEYDQSKFIVSQRDKIVSSSLSLLPSSFNNQKPNIIFISLESFSSRLVPSLGGRINGLTPNIDAFASSSGTTVFNNFYNASTPTITGLIAQMCSFLPPIGHEEIIKNDNFSNYLVCLPSVLKSNGYKTPTYLTAVNRNFASKNTIFKLMGFDNIYGFEEISAATGQKGNSVWGMTDHQQFPYLSSLIEKNEDEPFFYMISTIDGHTPFNMSRDMVKYGQGDNDVLNSIHSTDDAIGKFLEDFKTSRFASNTIIILAADHAFPPNYYPVEYFPKTESKNLSFYDEVVLMINVPDSILPKQIDIFSSSIDIAPTLMDLIGINSHNYFDGHSIFADRISYPNLLGMHEFGLYINQEDNDKRLESHALSQELDCSKEAIFSDSNTPLSLCELSYFYNWKRQIMDDGRLWIRSK